MNFDDDDDDDMMMREYGMDTTEVKDFERKRHVDDTNESVRSLKMQRDDLHVFMKEITDPTVFSSAKFTDRMFTNVISFVEGHCMTQTSYIFYNGALFHLDIYKLQQMNYDLKEGLETVKSDVLSLFELLNDDKTLKKHFERDEESKLRVSKDLNSMLEQLEKCEAHINRAHSFYRERLKYNEDGWQMRYVFLGSILPRRSDELESFRDLFRMYGVPPVFAEFVMCMDDDVTRGNRMMYSWPFNIHDTGRTTNPHVKTVAVTQAVLWYGKVKLISTFAPDNKTPKDFFDYTVKYFKALISRLVYNKHEVDNRMPMYEQYVDELKRSNELVWLREFTKIKDEFKAPR